MDQNIVNVRALAAKNAALLSGARHADGRLRDAAGAELEQVRARLDALSPATVIADPAKANEYQALLMQRGSLERLCAEKS